MNETEHILTSILNCKRTDLYTSVRKALSSEDQIKFDDIKKRRKNGEPLQYLLGFCDFIGINLCVDNRVLIPRPETEILVEYALENFKIFNQKRLINILDIGTGSGNISIALAKHLVNCHITSIDISKDSLDMAIYNAKINNVYDKIDFICADMKEFLMKDNEDKYDLIVSNPPYIKSEHMMTLPADVKHEPSIALDGGPDGLEFFRYIIKYSHRNLASNGMLICEIGDDQAQPILRLFDEFSFYKNIIFKRDYVGTERIFSAINL